MELKIASETDQHLWDSIVERSPNGTLFHTWKWLKLMEKNSGMKNVGMKSLLFTQQINATLYPLLIMEKDQAVGIFPLFFFRNPLFNFCYSPPHSNMAVTPHLGPIFPDTEIMKPEKKQILLNDFMKLADGFIKKDLNSKYILINTPPGFEDCRVFKWRGYTVEPRYTYNIDLEVGVDTVWKNFNRSLRYYIEKARKAGIVISDGNKDDSFYIHDLLKERNRATLSKEYLSEIYEIFFPDNIKIFIAMADSKRLSGIITLIYKDKVSFWMGAPKSSYMGLSPNELVLWESIKWASEHGFKTYEIVGADEYSLFPFKRKFNGKITPYYQMKWLSRPLNVFSSLYRSYSLLIKGDDNVDDL